MLDDTIAAISTPIGEGGIGIVRLSGARSLPIARRLFRLRSGAPLERPRSRYLYYGIVRDPASGEEVDEVLLSYLRAPRTYTREDMVEINCHGGALPLRRVLELTLREGARLARPGELTLRAFLHGRLDLAQAESVIDIVRARTTSGLRQAVGQLGGRLSREIGALRAEVLSLLAYLTATIDFAEDDIPEQDVEGPLDRVIARADELLREAEAGIIYRQGLQTAIVGRPNVGKSSLLNALLRENRAIVTALPGTTRDTLEETCNLRGMPVVLVDTAGIRETEHEVERLGVERSKAEVERADLVLLVLDASEPLRPQDRAIAALLADKPALVVLNKSDLPSVLSEGEVAALLPHAPVARTAAVAGAGIAELEEAVVALALGGRATASAEPLIGNPRHKDVLWRARERLAAARRSLHEGLPADFVTIDLSAAVATLGEITGETVTDDLLEAIFSRFCIGK